MTESGLLVVVPHSGTVVPCEIPVESLSDDFPALARNIDWYTDWLYDFRDMLGNRHLVFPYCSLLLEANRDPDILDDSVPLRDVYGMPVYCSGAEPSAAIRAELAAKYLKPFHRSIQDSVAAGATFLFDGHSTVTARGMADNQIDLLNFQHSPLDKALVHFSPDLYVETYAAELRKRLPGVKITVNASEYHTVYGHVCAAHSVNAMQPTGSRVPALSQETNDSLYRKADGTPDFAALNRLRCAFAESLAEMLRTVREMGRDNRLIDLHSGRQTFDFDCGAQALQTVMAHYGVDVRGDILMSELGTTPAGTPVKSMIDVARRHGFEVKAGNDWTLAQVKQFVDNGYPVIVLLQAWADRYMTLDDWRRTYDYGHYAIVIGHGKGVLVFEDPGSIRRTWLREIEFSARWHDTDEFTGELYRHFAMVLQGKQPDIRAVEHMD